MSTKYTAKQVAKWFIDKATSNISQGGEYLTQLKLQKLLYYAKGFYYVFEDKPLFDEQLKAQKLGPVVQSVGFVISKYKGEPIKEEFKEVEDIKDKKVIEFLEFVYNNLATVYAAKRLVDFTHAEKPWKETQVKTNISDTTIRNYFRDTYLGNNSNSSDELPVSSESLALALSRYYVVKFNKAYKELAKWIKLL